MKKSILLMSVISSLCFLSIISNAQAPNWQWAKSAYGPNQEIAYSIATDASGNVYMTGEFNSSTITFDTITLTNSGNGHNADDIFLAKYTSTGNVLWAKSFGAGGINNNTAFSLAVDAFGYIYVTGIFTSPSITFSAFTLINKDNTGNTSDIFLVKFDVNGNVIFAKSAGGTNHDYANSVAVDASGNVYITGRFQSTTIHFGSFVLTNTDNTSSTDIFLAKYNSNGNIIWVKSNGGTSNDQANSVAVDTFGNAYLTGYFQSPNIIFGTYTLTNTGYDDVFLVKYNASGNVLWAKNANGGMNGNYGDVATSVAVDILGNIYITGYFQNPMITFDSTTLINVDNSGSTSDLFLVSYNNNGNVNWAKSAGGMSSDIANSIAVDALGNTYIAGYFWSTSITFDSTTLINADNTSNTMDIFLTKYNLNGNVLWAKRAGNINNDCSYSVTEDILGNTYLAGDFAGSTISFDSNILTNVGVCDIFLAKLGCIESIINQPVSQTKCVGDNASFSLTTNSGAYLTYQWQHQGIDISGATNSTLTITDVSLSDTGNYTCNFNNSCRAVISTPAYLTVNPIDTTQQVQSICKGNNYNFYGTPLSETGTYYHTLTSSLSCDSVIQLALTVNPIDTTQQVQSICDGTNYNFYGTSLTTIGTYYHTLTSSMSCDSIIELTLIINPVDTTQQAQTICKGENYDFYGASLAEPGSYYYTFTSSAFSCDSIIKLTLTVNPVDTTQQLQSICEGTNYNFYGTMLTVAGIYYQTLKSSLGCDSLIKLTLSIDSIPQAPSITQSGIYLISNSTSGNQWYNDNGIITGETGQVFIPTITSHYYIIVTDSNGCISDTSNILYIVVTGIAVNIVDINNNVFPNPATNKINIELQRHTIIEILNAQGLLIKIIAVNDNKTSIDISDLERGLYFIKLTTDKEMITKKFIKE